MSIVSHFPRVNLATGRRMPAAVDRCPVPGYSENTQDGGARELWVAGRANRAALNEAWVSLAAGGCC